MVSREAMEKYRSIFAELTRLRVQTNQPLMDDLDKQLYVDALSPLKEPPQIARCLSEIRRTCEYCPIPAKVEKIVSTITGNDASLPPHVAAERRIVSKASVDREEDKMRLLTGISGEQAARSRERARAMISELAAKKPVAPRAGLGEPAGLMVEHFRELAIKRARIEESMRVPKNEGEE